MRRRVSFFVHICLHLFLFLKKGWGTYLGSVALAEAKSRKIEDKTFGLKNKNKSKKVQQYIKNVETTVRSAGQPRRGARDAYGNPIVEKSRAQLRKEKQAAQAEMSKLFAPVVPKKRIGAGAKGTSAFIRKMKRSQSTNPKVVLSFVLGEPGSSICQFFLAGTCKKGKKCKFVHDGTKIRKVQPPT